MNISLPAEALFWAKILFQDSLHFAEAERLIMHSAGEQFFVEAELAIEKFGTDMNAILQEMKQTLGIAGKKLFMPLRIALTGQQAGPDLASIASLLGKKKLKHRISDAFKMVKNGERLNDNSL